MQVWCLASLDVTPPTLTSSRGSGDAEMVKGEDGGASKDLLNSATIGFGHIL